MQKYSDISHLTRPVDPHYPTNIAIMILTIAVMAVIFLLRLSSGMEFTQAGLSALIAGGAVFIAWSLARELDPENDMSALVSASLMVIAVLAVNERFNVIPLFYMIPMSRMLVRSVGLPATLIDSIALFLFTAFVGFVGSWIYAMMGATLFLLDSILPERNPKQIIFCGLSIAVMVVAFFVQGANLNPNLPSPQFIAGMIVITILFMSVIVRSKFVNMRGDLGGELLIPIRVQAAQVVALLFGYHVAIWQGNVGVIGFLPLWILFLAVSIYPLIKPLLPVWDLTPHSRN